LGSEMEQAHKRKGEKRGLLLSGLQGQMSGVYVSKQVTESVG
jgi:hypothetical protein